jgi:hypothetical protein
MIRLLFAFGLLALASVGEELRGRLAAWSGGTGRGEFVLLRETDRQVVGYVEPLPRLGVDAKQRIELGTWVRVSARRPEGRSAGEPELYADRLTVEAAADPWIARIREYVDELVVRVFVEGDRDRLRKLSRSGSTDTESTLNWFIEHRHDRELPEYVRNLHGWVAEDFSRPRVRVLTNPGLSKPPACLRLRLKSEGREVVLESAVRVDSSNFDILFSSGPSAKR